MRIFARLTLGLMLAHLMGCDLNDVAPALPLDAASTVSIQDAAIESSPLGPIQDAAVSTSDAAVVSTAERGLPCAIDQLLTKHCRKCHGAPLEPGVPAALLTYADLTTQTAGVTRLERVKARIHDTQRPMPPVYAQDVLSVDALKTLDDWIAAGAPASTDACVQSTAPRVPMESDTSECEYLPALLAHNSQAADDTEGFDVPLVDTTYECFNFAIPWDKPVQALEFFPVIDDRRVVHHMALYSVKAPLPPGTHGPCAEKTNRTIVGGWSPGQDKQSWPAEYGALMPHDKSGGFQLEIHYDNVGRHKARDRSGLKVCATTKFRPKMLGMHVLSSDQNIHLSPGRQQVIASCTVWSDKGPATVLAASPHMHRLGVHLRTIVKHTDGTQETITDQPFSFDDQAIQFLKTPVIVRQGDVLTTTCSYNNTTGRVIGYSEGSDGEMCGNGLIASPPGSISGGLAGAIVDLLGVPNLCVGIGPEPLLGL
jgi:hypothetical protein